MNWPAFLIGFAVGVVLMFLATAWFLDVGFGHHR